jgi:hypothetical protein
MRLARLVVAVLALLAFLAPAAAADETRTSPGRHPSVVPADRVAGNTGGRLLGDWYVEILSRPAAASPGGGTANLCLDLGRHGRVLVPAGGIQDPAGKIEMSCTVKVGRPVALVMTSADCSTAEPAPFFGTTAREQRACVVGFLKPYDVRSIEVSVDGGKAVDIHRSRFFEVSPQRHVVYPEKPVFDAKPGPATFVAAGWMAEIRGMKRGTHTIEAVTTYGNPDGSTTVNLFVVHVDVVGGKGRA